MKGSLNRVIRHTPPYKKVKKMKLLNLYQQNEIKNAFNDFNRSFNSFFGDLDLTPEERVLYYSPAADIQETENCYVIKLEFHGFEDKNIEVNINDTYLSIESKQEDSKYALDERSDTIINRSFHLPANADPQTITARFKNGVLSINIQKRAESKRKILLINAA